MKQYYAERNGLIAGKLSLSLDELKKYFIHTYRYFSDKDYFEVAFNGIYEKDRWGNNRIQVLPPSMAPSPQVFLVFTLRITRYGRYMNMLNIMMKKNCLL